jgi:Co/Zn/Cd efflux system component
VKNRFQNLPFKFNLQRYTAVFIAVLILLSTFPLLQQAAELLMQRLPTQHEPAVGAVQLLHPV